MTNFEKLHKKISEKAMHGDNNVFYYKCKDENNLCSIGDNYVTPHNLLIFHKFAENEILTGRLNGIFIELLNGENDNAVESNLSSVLFDKLEKKLLVAHKDIKEIYDENTSEEDDIKVLVFQENKYYSEMLLMDSLISPITVRLIGSNDENRGIIRTNAFSLLAAFSKKAFTYINDCMEQAE